LVVNIFAAMCEEVPSSYELLVVPFQNPRGPKPAPASVFRSSQEARYDAYFLRRDFSGYRQVRLLLISQGALEVESYQRLMQHSPSRSGR
jgi:hypothetical protein